MACVERVKPPATLVVVPTVALLDQWWEEAAHYFNLALDEVHVITGTKRMRPGTINLAVLNTAAKLNEANRAHPCLLIVDECHKAASPRFRSTLDIPKLGALGLSATPERPYDDGLNNVLIPALGPVLFDYSYRDALRDGVIVPFVLRNVMFHLEEDRQREYDKLTRAIARAIQRHSVDSPEAVSLMLRRSRVLNLSLRRIEVALRIIAKHQGARVLVFHENIEACEVIHRMLLENRLRTGMYHSKMKLRERAEVLAKFRSGDLDVLVTCRALDEGFNVPEAEVGIIAASTATHRQRIQRLGRVLRPSASKGSATIYTLAATGPEVGRLKDEESNLEGVAQVHWSQA